MFKKIIKWWQSLRYYVIVDPTDNSITLSKRLFNHLKKHIVDDDKANVFVFYVPHTESYAFAVSPKLEQETQLCTIQYNEKHKCIGFESLCPSVAKIAYDYKLPHDRAVCLSVSINKLRGLTYYQINKPNGKYIRKYT